ncbi:MAG: nucleotide exchange factor GrpE [Candidatus Shapirobacteria bacterium]|nr:nucleotide exchange factor GrpE [Candidatus Shapirobacteria bacterium]
MTKTKTKSNDNQVEKLIALEQKTIELEDRLKRSLADYANLEKRIESQRQLFVTLATTAIVIKMIEILDDLYLTFNHIQDQGLKMAIDKFIGVLKSEGVEEIEALGQKFNPETMDCIEVVEGKENQVISVKKIGYKLNGHIIRPSQVAVGKSDQITN